MVILTNLAMLSQPSCGLVLIVMDNQGFLLLVCNLSCRMKFNAPISTWVTEIIIWTNFSYPYHGDVKNTGLLGSRLTQHLSLRWQGLTLLQLSRHTDLLPNSHNSSLQQFNIPTKVIKANSWLEEMILNFTLYSPIQTWELYFFNSYFAQIDGIKKISLSCKALTYIFPHLNTSISNAPQNVLPQQYCISIKLFQFN